MVSAGPCSNLRAEEMESDGLTLAWDAPTSGGPIVGYQVLGQSGGATGFTVLVADTGSAAPRARVRGLQSGQWCVPRPLAPSAPSRPAVLRP